MPFLSFGNNNQPNKLEDGLLQISSQAWHILVNGPSEPLLGPNRSTVAISNPSNSTDRSTSKSRQVYMICSLPLAGKRRSTPSPRRKRKCTTVDGIATRVEVGSSSDFDFDLWDSSRYMLKEEDRDEKWHGWCKPSCIPISIILVLIVLVVLLPLLDQKWEEDKKEDLELLESRWNMCRNTCRLTLVESIPEGLTFPNSTINHPSTFDGWSNLLNIANSTIEIGSFYWNLRSDGSYPHPGSELGEEIFDGLLHAGLNRSIIIKIAQSKPTPNQPNIDTQILQQKGAAEVRSLDFDRMLGGGVLHTKMWLVDRTHVYIGSANFDWKSLAQVKELGAVIYNCSCLAEDLGKIFDVYWQLGDTQELPSKWPPNLTTIYNKDTPMNVTFNQTFISQTYLSSSPPPFCPTGRTTDLDAILSTIDNAKKFVYISVMDYFPLMLYTKQQTYWPNIDDCIRSAAINRRVKIRMLISKWNYTRSSIYNYLQSLMSLNQPHVDIQVRLFIVPSFTPEQAQIPFARVNHNKYMVTENVAYIGTSNWAGDYFTNTAGVGLVINQSHPLMSRYLGTKNIRRQVQDIFNRDWNSPWAYSLQKYLDG